MQACVVKKLTELGYRINTEPYARIEACNLWYRNELVDDFHQRTALNGERYTIDRMNFAKRGCADDANMCEVVSIHMGAQEVENSQTEAVNALLEANRFDVMYRKQLERMSAAGTVGAYVRLDNADYLDDGRAVNGDIRLTYCYAENYVPLKVVNDEVLEAAFSGVDRNTMGENTTTLVVFRLQAGMYRADTYIFDKDEKEIDSYWIQLGDVKPFRVMRVAEVNNLRNMEGFGLPKIWNTIPVLKKLDLCNMVLHGDLDKGEKYVLTNEAVIEIDPDTGKPKERNAMWKRLFVFLGRKPVDGKAFIQEYNPVIRVDEITKTFELCLSLFSMSFGFGSKKYTFENGQIQTATQYIGERQDSMQELNKQRHESESYISGLIRAMLWFSNTFKGTSYDLDAEICIDFDDSYIEDRNTEIQNMRDDAMSFADIPEFTIQYIMMRMNVDRDEAVKIYENRTEEEDPETED